jgi:predicted anti-sigma-YlaC factor YlaD
MGRSAGWRTAFRVGLALVALLQLALALPDLLAAPGHGLHASREEASFDIAVAVGFLLAAPYPARARALLPVAGILSAALLVTTGIDLAHGATTLSHELVHGLALVETLLLWILGRGGRRTGAATSSGAPAVTT